MYGFSTPTDSPDYLGWILVGRRSRGPLTLEDVEPNSSVHATLLNLLEKRPEVYMRLVEEKRDAQECPFMALVLELNKAVHESDADHEEEDYRKREVYYFRSLQEVEQLLNKLGYSIANIKGSREIDAP